MNVTRRAAALGGLATALGAQAQAELPEFSRTKRFAEVDGLRMAYYEAGQGAPILFLHGNPTSSYLWRNVIPPLTQLGRCIAPDLVGMGDSEKLPRSGPGAYGFMEHCRYLDGLVETIGVGDGVTLVRHDWGGPLGFHWARRHARRVRAIAFMETFVVSQNDDNTPAPVLEFYARYRGEAAEREVLEENGFVENVLLRQFPDMNEADKNEYRRPYLIPGESRRPTLEWPRQVPINGDPADVHRATLAFLDFMATTPVPKLFIRGEPGALIARGRENVCRGWPAVQERSVAGRHFLPEESPGEIASHIGAWLAELNQ